jgi:putative nucleotidyltransferase with HDIG domain
MYLSILISLLLSALVGGILFFSHRDMLKKHLEFTREFLLRDISQRFTTLFQGYFYWDAMIEALEEGDDAFLEEMFLEMQEEHHLQEWLVEKEGALLYRFGSTLFQESLLTSLKPQTLEVISENGNFYPAQKLPLLYEDGTPSGYYALLGIDNVEILHAINAFLGSHIVITPEPKGIPFAGGYNLQETQEIRSFFKNPLVRNLLLLSFVLVGALAYSVTSIFTRRHALETQLLTMSMVLEKRDAYTSHHSCKVADNARVIAKALGLSSSRQDILVRAGLLHDLGKLFSPDAILLKKGRLTPEEFDIMKQHPGDGADMVENILKEHHLARIIREHHERWDGSGYPQGLSKEETLLESRILTVADVVDAMMSLRPYHAPRSPEEVREHLLSCRGTLYDPQVVDAALKALFFHADQAPSLPPKYAPFFSPGKTRGLL